MARRNRFRGFSDRAAFNTCDLTETERDRFSFDDFLREGENFLRKWNVSGFDYRVRIPDKD